MTIRQTGLSAPDPAAAGHAGVLAAGAGISGIDTGYHLKTRLAGTTFLILDARGSAAPGICSGTRVCSSTRPGACP